MSDFFSDITISAVTVFSLLIIVLFLLRYRRIICKRIMMKLFENIGYCFFRKGTREKIFEIDKMIYGRTEHELISEIEEYYSLMKGNIDRYLDKFYSLKSQKEQIGLWLKSKLDDCDKKGDLCTEAIHEMMDSSIFPDYDLNQRIAEICRRGNAEFNEKLLEILRSNRVGFKNGNYAYQIQSAADAYKNLCIPESAFNSVKAAGSGIAAGFVSAAVMDSMLAGLLDNILPEALAGFLAGPLGFGVGIMIGAAVNYVGVKIDELLNRAKYKDTLVKYIDDEKVLHIEIIHSYFRAHVEYAESIYLNNGILCIPAV